MNYEFLAGRVVSKPERILVNMNGKETPLVKFQVCDPGRPYSRKEPMYLEVHCVQDFIHVIFNQIKPGKHVLIVGPLKQKKYRQDGILKKSIYYIAADMVYFLDTLEEESNERYTNKIES